MNKFTALSLPLLTFIIFFSLSCGIIPRTVTAAPSLTVHFIDVGQGDAILIDAGSTEILIDAGEKSSGAVDYIKNYVNGPIEAMIATHSHTDHIGGLIPALENFSVRDIWLNEENAPTKTFAEFMNMVNAEQAVIHRAERGNLIKAGILTLQVHHPAQSFTGDANGSSTVVSLVYGNVKFLFTGDADSEAESDMLYSLLDVDILKVAHHGSRYSSSPKFLAAVKPEVAIYCAGTGNSYGHPHAETINALNTAGAKVYGTDTHGTITVKSDGKTCVITTAK
jgi:competence protein ComEC